MRPAAARAASAIFLAAVSILSAQTTSQPTPPATQPTTAPAVLTASELFEYASPAVVQLLVKDEDGTVIASGSGVIIEIARWKESWWASVFPTTILTNWHVIRPAVEIEVVFSSGENAAAQFVIAKDEHTDLAILPIGRNPSGRVLQISRAPSPKIGDRVFAIGSPKGLQNTLSEGIVSGYRAFDEDTELVQFSAPISPGSSGGPLLLPDGSILGITSSFISTGQNLNFAIPRSAIASILRTILEESRLREIWEGASISRQIDSVKADLRLDSIRTSGDYLMLLDTAHVQFQNAQFAEAIETLSRIPPDKASKYRYFERFLLGICHSYLQPDSEISLLALQESVSMNPKFTPARSALMSRYRDSGRYVEALAEATVVVEQVPRCALAYVSRAGIWAELGLPKNAETDVARAIELSPRSATTLLGGAGALMTAKSHQKAVLLAKRLVEFHPDDSWGHEILGRGCMALGDFKAALDALKKARALAPASRWSDLDSSIAKCKSKCEQNPEKDLPLPDRRE